MSLVLNNSPKAPTIKTFGVPAGMKVADSVIIEDGSIPVSEFLGLVARELCNGPLDKEDHRLKFIEAVQKATIADGYPAFLAGQEIESKRLIIPFPHFEDKKLRDNPIEIVDGIVLSRFDLCFAAYYVLTNSSLNDPDPRSIFVNLIKEFELTPGKRGVSVKVPDGIQAALLETPAPIYLQKHPLNMLWSPIK